MGFTPKTKPRVLVPEGQHHAVCYGVVDIGTQQSNFGPKRKLIIFWELPELRIDIEREGGTENLPRVTNGRYTATLHKKSNLSIHLTGWRGKAFTSDERRTFDFYSLLGQNCLLTIVHEWDAKGENQYDNIAGITGLPKAMSPLAPENPLMKFCFEDNGKSIPKGIYDWLAELIKQSSEYRGASTDDEQLRPEDTSPTEPPDYDTRPSIEGNPTPF